MKTQTQKQTRKRFFGFLEEPEAEVEVRQIEDPMIYQFETGSGWDVEMKPKADNVRRLLREYGLAEEVKVFGVNGGCMHVGGNIRVPKDKAIEIAESIETCLGVIGTLSYHGEEVPKFIYQFQTKTLPAEEMTALKQHLESIVATQGRYTSLFNKSDDENRPRLYGLVATYREQHARQLAGTIESFVDIEKKSLTYKGENIE